MTQRTKTILYTIAGMFFVACATTFLNAGGDLWSMTSDGWHAVVNNGVAAVLTGLIALFGPPAARTLGIGSK